MITRNVKPKIHILMIYLPKLISQFSVLIDSATRFKRCNRPLKIMIKNSQNFTGHRCKSSVNDALTFFLNPFKFEKNEYI